MDKQPQYMKKEEAFDPRLYLRVINRRKMLLILPFLGVVFTVMLGSLFISPEYQSSTTILISEPQLLSQNVERMASGGSRERLDMLRREITSREYLIRLIRTLGWGQAPGLRSWAESQQEKFPDLTVDEIVERTLISSLRKQIFVRQEGSDLLMITARDKDPKQAQLLAKTLSQVFIDETLRRELSGVRGALEFSNEQLAIYEQRLEESRERLRNFRESIIWTSLQSSSDGDEGKVARVNSQVATAESDLRQAQDEVTSLTIRLQNLSAEPLVALSDPGVVELKGEYTQSGRQIANLLTQYTWRDGRVITLSEQINSVRKNLQAELDRVCRSATVSSDLVYCEVFTALEMARADVEFYRNKWQTLSGYVNNFERTLVRAPNDELMLERLQEEVGTNRKLYQMFLDQTHGVQIREAAHRTAAEGRFRILEPAMLQLNPVKPNRLRLATFSVVMGFLLGLALVFLVETLDHSLNTVEEVEQYLGHPVLVTIPRMELGEKRRKKARLAVVVILGMLALILIAIFIKQRFMGA
jgi:polysaccharide chain length determinant protein (PEP-CTERM system associated)